VRRYQLDLGIPFVYVTHNQEEALTMSDRIAVMDQGRLQQIAEKHEVYTHPATPFVAGFVGHSNKMTGPITSASESSAAMDWQGIELKVPPVKGAVAGVEIDYFVKCDRFSLHPAAETPAGQTENALEVRLRDIIFKGTSADYLVVADNGVELTVSGPVAGRGMKAQDRVRLSWTVDDGHAFVSSGG
jgi:ABC-type Fe3+/spermidine/putrescine transport system ATPase subunit